jgi:hypothetical protein
LLKADRRALRDFYEIEAIRNGWSARQLERQMASLLFERLARSRDKKGVLAPANEGQVLTRPQDAIKDQDRGQGPQAFNSGEGPAASLPRPDPRRQDPVHGALQRRVPGHAHQH